MRPTITILCFLFGVSCIFAQVSPEPQDDQEVKFEVVEFPRGPSNVGIQKVYQDSTGYLWFCTIEGLWRWDGYHFKNYRHDPFDSTTLSDNHLENLLFDSQGKIWVGTFRAGVNLFDPLTETFQRFPYEPHNLKGTSGPYIRSMEEDRNGNIWMGTGNSLCRLDRESMQFTHFFHDSTDNSSLALGTVFDIHEDQQGRLWIATTGGGLNLFDPQKKSFIHYQHNPEDPTSLAKNNVSVLLEDSMGRFWVSSGNTLNLMDREKGTFQHFPYDPTQPNNPSFQYSPITSMMEDQSGIIWLSNLREGLHSYDPITGKVKIYTHNSSNPNSVSQDGFWKLSQSQDGTIWIGGGIFGKLNQTRSANQIFQVYNLEELPPQTNRVHAYLYDRGGRLWLGTSGSGLIQYDLEKGIQQQFLNRPGDASSIRKNIVRVLFEDSDGYIWIALGGNRAIEMDRMYVDRIDPKTKKITHILEDVPWKNEFHSPNPILDIEEDSAGFIWIATVGEGLLRIDRRTGQYTSFKHDPNIKNTLGGNQVFTI